MYNLSQTVKTKYLLLLSSPVYSVSAGKLSSIHYGMYRYTIKKSWLKKQLSNKKCCRDNPINSVFSYQKQDRRHRPDREQYNFWQSVLHQYHHTRW